MTACRGRSRGTWRPMGGTSSWDRCCSGTVVDDYQEGQLRPPGRPGHSLDNIFQAAAPCLPWDAAAGLGAVDMFCGYLVLDAWVGNQDRHDQNWAALRQTSAPGAMRLASSYDHASSLGSNLLDEKRDAGIGRSGTVGPQGGRAPLRARPGTSEIGDPNSGRTGAGCAASARRSCLSSLARPAECRGR